MEDFPFQLVLLLVAGLVWVIGKVGSAAGSMRERTRLRIEREERKLGLDFGEVPSPPEQPPRQEAAPPPVRERPPLVPRFKEQPKVTRRIIRRTVPQAAPAQSLRKRLRDPVALREGIVLREILGPPKALRGRWIR